MKNQKTIGMVLLVVGVALLVVSLAADVIGIGIDTRFGYKQITGSIVGTIVAVIGVILYSRQKIV